MKVKDLMEWFKSQISAILTVMDAQKVVYALRDPRDWHVRYVGYTKNLFKRIHYHYRYREETTKGSTLATDWLIELSELGLLPISEILEVIESGVNWEERESYWITYFKEQGEPLLNGTTGGLGGKHAPETAIKTSESMRKVWASYTADQRMERSQVLRRSYTGNQYSTKDGVPKPGAEAAKARTGESAKKFWQSAPIEKREQIGTAHREAFIKMEANKKEIVLAALYAGACRKGQRHTWRKESRDKVSKASSKYWADKLIDKKMDLVQPMLIARKNAWANLSEDERKKRMAKVRAGKKRA